MSVFMIVNASVNQKNREALKTYSEKSSLIFKDAGAKPVQKIALDYLLLGNELPDMVAVTEWPSREKILEVFNSEAYKELVPIRDQAFSKLNVFISKA